MQQTSSVSGDDPESPASARSAWMSELARSQPADLAQALASLGSLPTHTWLRRPETGLVMVRARAGGEGAKFNLGEMSVTRCAVQLATGTVGLSYIPGADADHARDAAVADALLQCTDWHASVMQRVINMLKSKRELQVQRDLQDAAATRVQFYTMARGDS